MVHFFQCPFICHVLYLLARKESGKSNVLHVKYGSIYEAYDISPFLQWLLRVSLPLVRVFRVRKLLELQSKLVNILLVRCFVALFIKATSLLHIIPINNDIFLFVSGYLFFLLLEISGKMPVCVFVFISPGKAAVPLAPSVTLQSLLPWNGGALYSISIEGWYMDMEQLIDFKL